MQDLTLGDLETGVSDLLAKHTDVLDHTNAGKLYGPLLTKKLEDIRSLPEGLGGNRPLAAELADADIDHDGYGGAMFHFVEAIVRHPDADEETRAAAERVRATFVPTLQTLRLPLPDEVNAAKAKRATIDALKDDLKRFAVPVGGKTLLDWAKDFVDAGDAIGDLLSGRAEATASKESASATGALRASTIGLLNRFRQALRDEAAAGAAPADAEQRVFAYVDQLTDARSALRKPRVKKKSTPDTGTSGASEPKTKPDDK